MFSELVDDIVRRTNRPDFLQDIAIYTNEVLRSVHCTEFFYRDQVEILLNADARPLAEQNTFVWERPRDFRAIVAVKYLDKPFLSEKETFIANIPPGIGQANRDMFYYGVGTNFVFYDRFGLGRIAVCYVTAPRRFTYYKPNERPAVFNRETNTWSYLDRAGKYVPSLGSDELDKAARDKVYDWLLADYDVMISSGVSNKLFSILEDPRNKVEYANFKEALKYVRATEKYESTGEIGYNR